MYYDPWLTEEIEFDIEAVSIVSPPYCVLPSNTYTPTVIVRNNCNYSYPVSFFTAECTIKGYHDYVRINQSIQQDSTVEVVFGDWMVPPEDSTSYLMNIVLFYAVDSILTNNTISMEITALYTGINDKEVTNQPQSYALIGNYPNPFNASTKIRYCIPKRELVSLKVYDLLGKEIGILINEEKSAGVYETDFNGDNLASGLYFYKLRAGDFIQTQKLLLIK